MSSQPGLPSPWAIGAAVLACLIALGIQLGVVGDILSPSVWLDVISLWPVAAIGLVSAPVVWLLAGRRSRHLGIVGLSLFTWLALGLALHLSGSAVLPVASTTVEGPAASQGMPASLSIELDDGALTLVGGAEQLYRFSPIRAGGAVGAPVVFEQTDGASLTIVAVPRADPGAYVFRGWNVELSEIASWSIDAAAPTLTVDLTGLSVGSVSLTSDDGEVRLGPTTGAPSLDLSGAYRVVVPRDVPVRLMGEGVVPGDWSLLDGGGAASPTAGDGWVISAATGSRVEVWYG